MAWAGNLSLLDGRLRPLVLPSVIDVSPWGSNVLRFTAVANELNHGEECSQRQPLLTEFFDEPFLASPFLRVSRRCVSKTFAFVGLSKSGLRPTGTAMVFGIMGSAALLLSFLGRAHFIQLHFVNGGVPFTREVGYFYDVSAGPFFAIVAPFIIGLGLRFVQQAQANLSQESELQLQPGDVLTIATANRKVFCTFVLHGLVLGSFGFTFGSEFLPVKGDYYNLPFGYVQANAIAGYKPGIPFSTALGSRRAQRLPAIGQFSPEEKVFLTEAPCGPVSERQIIFFWAFIVVALTTHALFAVVVFWILFKVIFILWVYAVGIAKGCGREGQLLQRAFRRLTNPRVDIKIAINEFDPGNRFGLSCLMESLKSMGLLITLSVGTLLLEIMRMISGDPGALKEGNALVTLRSVVQSNGWHLLLNIKGPGGAGYFAAAFAILSVTVLFLINRNITRYKKAREKDRTLTASQLSILRAQDFNLVRQVIVLTGPGCLAAGSLMTLLYQHPEKVVDAALVWERFVHRVGIGFA